MASNDGESGLTLSVLPGRFSICRLEEKAPVPLWAFSSNFFSVTRTSEELSIVCPEKEVPEGVQAERGWACLKVNGPLDFALTGVLASLVAPLAVEQISIFAISTFDTDYLLVKSLRLDDTILAITRSGHKVFVQ